MGFRKYFTRKNILFGLILIGVFILGFSITYFVLTLSKVFVKSPLPTPKSSEQQLNFAPAPEVSKEKGVYNTVLLGYGGAGHEGSLLTDSIIIVHVNANT
ncbi:MAG TPA: hypothetical protein VKC54_02165, partial [Patescibacteria group bacterium]|nr:hypothetical protein [Patescibacteria group bacterium]